MKTIDSLKPGESAEIIEVKGTGSLRHHLLDMGLTPKTEVTLQKTAPMGDPVQIELRGYELTLRLDEAKQITITEPYHGKKEHLSIERHTSIAHPKFGEKRKYTKPDFDHGRKLRVALVGNQNCGKTTLFNQLTGSNQHVGNFPGVTVDQKDGQIRGYENAVITDLPGIYSLSPYSTEEIVTRRFILDTKPDGIINIVDATNMERNLYLTMQLMELDTPMVVALNMMDEVIHNGGTVLVNQLEHILGIPVVPISASHNQGVEELIDHVMAVACDHLTPGKVDFCIDSDESEDPVAAVHRCIHAIAHMIENDAKKVGLPIRFAASKLVEHDPMIELELALPQEKKETCDHLISILESESGFDSEAALANMRFSFLEDLCAKTVIRPHESVEHRRSTNLDRILTGKYTAIPCFIGIMGFVFFMTFSGIGAFLSDGMTMLVDGVISWMDAGLTVMNVNPVVHSLVIDGIANGVGSVLSFLPVIVTLFFFLSILEDTGYMARVAFIMDRLLRKIGLSGRSFVPMLIGFGCTVPAVMATRTLSSERDRRMTILMTPFMSCSAKLPIYTLMITAFFPRNLQPFVMISLYLGGIAVGILYAFILKKTVFPGEPVPFVMELPNYRLPSARSLLRLIWEKAEGFVKKAFTVIFLASLIIWFLQSFDSHLNLTSSADDSILAMIGSFCAPVFAPLGFNDWRVSTALITGLTAKESVVSTLILLSGSKAALQNIFTPFTAFVFLVFVLLYTPCVAAIGTVKKELGSTTGAFLSMVMQCVIAWLVAFAVHTLGILIGLV